MPNILDNEDLYNVITLGGLESPGKVTLSGHDRAVEWDVKSGPSLNGATTTIKSRPPIQFTATFELLRDEGQGIDDFAAWPPFLRLIQSTVASTNPKALDIYHPALAANDIKSVCMAKVGGEIYDLKGGMTVAVTFQEYRPPKKQGGTPIGSKDNKPDPNQAAKDEVARLTAQYQATPWG